MKRWRSFALPLLIFMLAGCEQKRWCYKEVVSDNPIFNSAQIKCLPENQFSGIELQLLRGDFGIVAYLNVCSRRLFSNQIVIQIGEANYLFEGCIMEGGQRMLMPKEATLFLLQSLLSGVNLTIQLEGFSLTVPAANFFRYYEKFKAPTYENLF